MKSHFPIINYFEKKHIIYADSAATTLKLKTVIDSVSNFYSFETSNVFRGLHLLAETATEKVEMSRDIVAAFIGANSSEIVFTSGATESINIVANGIEYEDDSEIIVSILEHHSNYLPWIEKAKVISLEIDEYGYIDIEQLRDNITCKTKLIAVTYISNVTGNIQPIKNIIDIAHQNGINVLVDATQAISHIPIDVKEIDCDYLVFSSHKIFGPSGVGVLYCKDSLLDKLNILKFGGGMVNRIYSNRNIIYKDPPYSFEAGTPNIEGIIGLGASLDFFRNNRLAIYNYLCELESIGVDKVICSHPFLISLAKEKTNLIVVASTIAEISNVRSALYYEELGADIIVPSVSINHDLKELILMKDNLQHATLKILVNEVCLGNCPYRRFHHAHLSKANHRNYDIDYTSSCTKKYLDNPYLFLTNNVIRPEDLKLYEGICDNFKLVGRTIEDDILVNMIKAYGNEYYDGNLLDILDNRFQRVINIPNNKLNELIYKKMKCDKNCAKCGYCKDLYTTIQNEFV